MVKHMIGRRLVSRAVVPAVLLSAGVVGWCVVWAVGLSSKTLDAAEPKPITKTKLTVANAHVADLAWMEGTWRAFPSTGAIEERWSGPLGDSLVGTFRSLRGERARMYELMTISDDGGRLYFWLKHFTRKLASWEKRDEALSFALTQIEPNKAVFKNPKYEDPQTVTYYRPVPETLIVTLEGTKDGEPISHELQFSRVGP